MNESNTSTETMTPFRRFLHAYNASRGLNLPRRYPSWDDDDLPDVCPSCHEPCELDGEPTCYECKCDPTRGKAAEVESEDCEVCEMCHGAGTIYVPRWNSWLGMVEVRIECECVLPVGISYDVMQEAVAALSGLNAV